MPAPTISFEFFPPKSLDASFQLWDTLRALQHLDPSFVSVTYGAGGTTRELTHEAVETIGTRTGIDVAAHLTCVDASRGETLAIADRYAEAGVSKIVALRGDPPAGSDGFRAREDGFASSVELVEALARKGKFEIAVGAYPDPHPEAGATSAITQFFFEAETFFRFRDRCAKAGIDAPILPGILPIQSWTGVKKFAARCGARIPAALERGFETAERDGRTELLALTHCTTLCTRLLDEGLDHLHFYTLNRPDMTREVVNALGLIPPAVLEKVA